MVKPWFVMLVLVVCANSLVSAAPVQVNPTGHKAAAPDISVGKNGDVAILWVDRSPNASATGSHDRHSFQLNNYLAPAAVIAAGLPTYIS